MKINAVFYLFIITASLCSCENKEAETNSIKQEAETAMDIDSRLKKADSLVVVFYNDPYGDDSLRYTRYYKQVSIIATGSIAILQTQLLAPIKMQEKRAGCRGEGKIWCFTDGKIFQTLYFSTRCEECCHLYLIKDGNFYYTRISSSFTEWLEELKPKATSPTGQTIEAESL